MKLKMAGLLVLVIVASGCSGNLPDDPSEGFEQLNEKMEGEDFHIEYEISVSSSEDTITDKSFTLDFYSFDGVQKAVGNSFSTFSTTRATYMVDNSSVTCSESSGEISCSKGGDPGLFQLVTEPKFDSFNYSGSGEFAGRGCKMFEVSPDMRDIAPPAGSSLDAEICVDRGLGFPSMIELNVTDSSEDASITAEALSFDRDVDQSNVEIPKALSVSASCYGDPSVSITSFKPVDSVELSVNSGEAQSVELGDRFETTEVDVSEDVVEGSNEFSVESREYSTTASCYFSNYSFSEPSYDFSDPTGVEESDLDLSEFNAIGGRIDNGDFSDAEMTGDNEVDIDGWSHTDGTTGHLRTWEDGIDGQSIGTGWKQNGFDDEASISQDVDLSGVEAVGLDVEGTGGNPQRSKIVLEVDGEEQGFFIKRPQQETTYRDLGVELSEDYSGVHNVTVRWVQIQGDNLGNSMIDNVEAYS